MTIRIVGGTLRDLSYIAANMRPADKAECDAQFDEWTPTFLAASSLRDHAYVAEIDGNPEAAFGAGQIRQGQWVAWSWMTARGWRAVPRISAFVKAVMVPDIYASGGQRVEARALESNVSARRWLLRMGATERCALPCFGRNGENFILYDWVRTDWANVLLLPEASASARAAENAAA